MIKEPLYFIEHILERINLIEKFLNGLGKEELSKDLLRQSAILRELEVIGEAVKNIPNSFRNKYNNVEWIRIAGLRDKLIYHYFGIDFNTIWDVIDSDLPVLKRQIKDIKVREKKE